MNASSLSKEAEANSLICQDSLPLMAQPHEQKRFRHVAFHFDSDPSYILINVV
jgi:hypothetical protein